MGVSCPNTADQLYEPGDVVTVTLPTAEFEESTGARIGIPLGRQARQGMVTSGAVAAGFPGTGPVVTVRIIDVTSIIPDLLIDGSYIAPLISVTTTDGIPVAIVVLNVQRNLHAAIRRLRRGQRSRVVGAQLREGRRERAHSRRRNVVWPNG